MIFNRIILASAFAVFASVSAFSADEIDDNVDVNDIPTIRLGAKIPAVVYTNKYDGLTTYWKKKGKIYNDEMIVVSKTNVKGFSVTEDDASFLEWFGSDAVTNVCTSLFVTNNNKQVIFYTYEEPNELGTQYFDAYFKIVFENDVDFTSDELTYLHNIDKIGDNQRSEIYKATTFDTETAKFYDRVSTVKPSLITDKASAIATFNTILAALKAQ